MVAITNFQAESTLTDRYQTTVPENVRRALGLNKRDKIHYTIEANGQVIMSRAKPQEKDTVLEKFLSFLAQDMENNPQCIQTISADLVNRVQYLVADVEFNLDEPLSDEDE